MIEKAPQSKDAETYSLNPENLTRFGTKTIVIDGTEYEIHKTNNLPVLLEAYLQRLGGETPRNPQEVAYHHTVSEPDKQLFHIMMLFTQKNPELFTTLADIIHDREQEYKARQALRAGSNSDLDPNPKLTKTLPTEEESIQRTFYYSQVFDKLASIAKEFDPNYDIEFFVR